VSRDVFDYDSTKGLSSADGQTVVAIAADPTSKALFVATYVWNGSAWVPSTGGGGGGGAVTQGTVPWIVQATQVITPLAPATASVTNVDSVVVASNASRKGLIVINLGLVNVNFGCGATSILNGGITLIPNGTWVMDTFTFTTSAIHAICPGAATLAIQEYN